MKNVEFFIASGRAALVLKECGSMELNDAEELRAKSFIEFPNIKTPSDFVGVFSGLSTSPVEPLYINSAVERISTDELLSAFDLKPTRTEKKKAADLLGAHSYDPSKDSLWLPYLEVRDCLYMARDMKGLLSILMYLHGKCTPHALKMNTENGFAFLDALAYESGSSYINYMNKYVCDIDSGDFEYMVEIFFEDLQAAYLAPVESLRTTTRESLRQFVEGALNNLMLSAHPVIEDGKFLPVGNGTALGNIYAFWIENILTKKTLVCDECGRLTVDARPNKRFCSDSCRVKNNKAHTK